MIYQKNHSLSTEYYTVEIGRNFSFPLHLHGCYEIIAVLDGEMTVSIDFNYYRLNEGEIIIIFPHQIHSLLTKATSAHKLCIFSEKVIPSFNSVAKGKRFANPVISIKNLPVLSIFADCEATDELIKIKGILYLICAEYMRRTEFVLRSFPANIQSNFFYNIFTFINDHYTGKCTLAMISNELNYNYSYISEEFNKLVGMSFSQYIHRLRVSEACYLLKNSDDTILQISIQCGFGSLRNFNRVFTQIMAITPSEYRSLL